MVDITIHVLLGIIIILIYVTLKQKQEIDEYQERLSLLKRKCYLNTFHEMCKDIEKMEDE